MGISWLPDAPVGRNLDNDITTSPVFLVDTDNEDEIVTEVVNDHNGYQLLGDREDFPDTFEQSDEEDSVEANETSENTVDVADVLAEENSTRESCSFSGVNSEVAESRISNEVRRDITVDYDQVRAAMAQITLPASAVPPWATSIPDSEWCTYLQNRIRRLQEDDGKDSEAVEDIPKK